MSQLSQDDLGDDCQDNQQIDNQEQVNGFNHSLSNESTPDNSFSTHEGLLGFGGMAQMEGMGSFMRGFSHMGRMGLGRMGAFAGLDQDLTQGTNGTDHNQHFVDQQYASHINGAAQKILMKNGKATELQSILLQENNNKIQEPKLNEETEEERLARLTKKLQIAVEQQITLIDWAVRGSAQVIRLVLQYIQVPYRQRKYVYLTKDQWYNVDQPRLRQSYPAIELPYLQDGQTIVCGPEAIITYLLHKYKRTELLGQTIQDKVRLATARTIYWQLLQDYYVLCYGQYQQDLPWEQVKEKYVNKIFKAHLVRAVNFLRQSKSNMLWIDFGLAEMVSIFNQMDLRFKENNSHIISYANRVIGLPHYIVYRKSDRFHERPYNGFGAMYK